MRRGSRRGGTGIRRWVVTGLVGATVIAATSVPSAGATTPALADSSTAPVAAPASRSTAPSLVLAPRAMAVGGLDRGFDSFGGPRTGWPGLLPLVAGTTVDVELRFRAPVFVRGGVLTLLLPNALDVDDVRPVGQVNGYGFAPKPREGAFTVRPSATFQRGLRPRGHCEPVPGGPRSQEATRTDRGWRLTVRNVTCAPRQLLRLRVYGVTMPDAATTVRVPWRLLGESLVRGPRGDAAPVARAVGTARVRVVEPSDSRIEVDAPATYQLIRDTDNGVPQDTVTAAPITVTVSIVRPDGSLDIDWTGWLTVSPDVVATAYRSPCDSARIPVRVRAGDDGVVTVPNVEMIRDEAGYVNVWAGDHGLTPGSSTRVEPVPPPDGLPYSPASVCPVSYH